MRTAAGVIIGVALTWCIIAIWHGPSAWFFTRIPPATHPDHVDKIIVWRDHVEQKDSAWPTSSTTP